MGTRAVMAAVLALAARDAAGEPRSARVEVSPACAEIVDTDEVVVALRVELGSVGVGSVSARDRGDVALAVDCPSPHEVVIALSGRRTSITVADVAPKARARVVALTVAEQLRPSGAPDVERAAEPAPPARWELGGRADGVVVRGLWGGIGFATLARRFGMWTIQPAIGVVGGQGDGGAAIGAIAEVRGSVEPLHLGRLGVGASLSVLGVTMRTYQSMGIKRDSTIGVRGEPFVRLPLGGRWSGYAALGLGHTIESDSHWFGTLAFGASTGL